MKKTRKINLETCKLEDIQAAGLEKNIFVNPIAFEKFVWESACRLYGDWKEAYAKVDGVPEITREMVDQRIREFSDQIFISFWDVEGDE